MIHSIFGWDYPPGCHSIPDDEDHPCMICWHYEDKCKCPVCPVCEVIGDPRCYMNHGLKLTEEQVSMRLKAELEETKAAEAENKWDQTETFWHNPNGDEE
jgi:hypothetical protein